MNWAIRVLEGRELGETLYNNHNADFRTLKLAFTHHYDLPSTILVSQINRDYLIPDFVTNFTQKWC